jgi:hypothetical protein
MIDLTHKPQNFPFESVWCEGESLFLLDNDVDEKA